MEYIVEAAVSIEDDHGDRWVGPLKGKGERLIRCKDCKSWQTPIAYAITGKCKATGAITNKNYFCGEGKERG